MNPQLKHDITEALKRDYKAVQKGQYLNRVECPSCHKREAFTSTDKPWVIKCGRSNKCGDSWHVKELFPEFFETWTERYQPKTEQERNENPTAVADGYLRDGRGFDLIKIRGWYTQEYYHDHELNEGTTTVRFKMPNGFNERFLDKPQRFGKQKSRTVGDYKGRAWVPPVFTLQDLATAEEIWVVEGIFDAIAHYHAGNIAVSNISSSNYPSLLLQEIQKQCAQGKRPRIIWAQDSDRAGRTAILKFRDRAERDGWKCGAAQPPSEQYDWNDLLQRDQLTDKDIEKYLHYGDLLLAKTASAKALLMYNHRPSREFWFTYEAGIWWWKLDMDAYDKEVRSYEKEGGEPLTAEQRDLALKSAGCVTQICTALPRPLYFQANQRT
ncbi:toprim domain-containing protein [Neptuniibacter sp. CAU 1671]|uniref:toprim domain-containing protein n=1 Tax=Neptuniibacter sp. CAU 1671 TaxID=3032593 RepID=UPI0023D9FE5D|nr:toprim domain-containing protein [Neptuniibacter sp. CAU 1671]MDF2180973.1 toprim domain-containing protein [Neptuniibacter sp. CAU 1671]